MDYKSEKSRKKSEKNRKKKSEKKIWEKKIGVKKNLGKKKLGGKNFFFLGGGIFFGDRQNHFDPFGRCQLSVGRSVGEADHY